ncbi:ABC transporter ATP-binding protein [Fusibacter ferrireducens]|uniref:ABC transporter ATP-binding protein n=1 Tax=Fusibacter ferrireducens TaxID=2785058 RepID=A0ABR9ZUW1_9FIRM|nr:dipeptide/oligopeptide/nickel ABC transporter ATP-binding protein [Fusibacter ferrireducens]MBF4693948.1 ABC transporter ATP-binding protein [Fusibacter ferrireducens]
MQTVLEVKDLKKTFYKNKVPFVAVDGISFDLNRGECLGLVGESGCGKSTIARIITQLTVPDAGNVFLDKQEILSLKGRKRREIYTKIQMVFQTPQDSFDPRCTLGDGIMESMINNGIRRKQAKERMYQLLDRVELTPEYAIRYPHEVSGGQCQRAAIARALAVDPQLIICDEATSALDVTIQAQIMALLKRLQREKGLSLVLICHDLALVQKVCDRVLVMYKGRIIEQGVPDQIIQHPKADYTKILVDSVF